MFSSSTSSSTIFSQTNQIQSQSSSNIIIEKVLQNSLILSSSNSIHDNRIISNTITSNTTGNEIKKDKEPVVDKPVVVDIKNRDSETVVQSDSVIQSQIVVQSESVISSKVIEKEKVVDNIENGKDQKGKEQKEKTTEITSDYKTPEKVDKKLNDHKRNKIQIQIKKKGIKIII